MQDFLLVPMQPEDAQDLADLQDTGRCTAGCRFLCVLDTGRVVSKGILQRIADATALASVLSETQHVEQDCASLCGQEVSLGVPSCCVILAS